MRICTFSMGNIDHISIVVLTRQQNYCLIGNGNLLFGLLSTLKISQNDTNNIRWVFFSPKPSQKHKITYWALIPFSHATSLKSEPLSELLGNNFATICHFAKHMLHLYSFYSYPLHLTLSPLITFNGFIESSSRISLLFC